MTTPRSITFKASFRNELLALDMRDAREIDEKINLLASDPHHAPPVKKRLRHADGLYRLRHKHYRIFYIFDDKCVSVLAVRKRADAYDTDLPDAEHLEGPDEDTLDLALVSGRSAREPGGPSRWLEAPEDVTDGTTRLPDRITGALLRALRIHKRYHVNLIACDSEEALLACESVPDDVRLQVFDALVGRPLEEVLTQPEFVVQQPEDLLRYKQGELLGFLLKLNPEQEKFVSWAASSAGGPTLLKGGPGTGKSTVALYRTRVMIQALKAQGLTRPRILFTTYTNALTRFSEQLLSQLLGGDAACVEVCTADSLAVRAYAAGNGARPHILQGAELERTFKNAVANAKFDGNSLVQAAQRKTLAKLGRDYVQDEVLGVIHARDLRSLQEYLDASRPGRNVPLNKTQREAVWRVHEALTAALAPAGHVTWQMLHAGAAHAVKNGSLPVYDAVLVDESQDLDASTLRMLVGLCSAPNRLFLTADANQSIYGGSFRWKDVHEDLRFTGRTGVLRANHRSTKEIGEAAHSYLGAGGLLDGEVQEREYVHTGPLPAVRAVAAARDESALLERFFTGATRDLRLGLAACAVLCPTNAAAKQIAETLTNRGVKATFMEPKELDLSALSVKTLTLKSAKGLEFPVVALAGFTSGWYPVFPTDCTDEARQEILDQERRTMFVAMTRAMRALLVVTPSTASSAIFDGFDAGHWNLGS